MVRGSSQDALRFDTYKARPAPASLAWREEVHQQKAFGQLLPGSWAAKAETPRIARDDVDAVFTKRRRSEEITLVIRRRLVQALVGVCGRRCDSAR